MVNELTPVIQALVEDISEWVCACVTVVLNLPLSCPEPLHTTAYYFDFERERLPSFSA